MPDSYIAPGVTPDGLPIGPPEVPTTEPSALDALEAEMNRALGKPPTPAGSTAAEADGESLSSPSDSPPSDLLTPPEVSETIPGEAPPASLAPPVPEGVDSSSSPPPPGTPAPTDLDLVDVNAAFREMYGMDPTREQAVSLLKAWGDLAYLDDERANLVNYVMGGGDLSVFQPQQQAPAPTPPAPTPPPVDEWGDPTPAQTVSPMVQAELDNLKAQVAQQQQFSETMQQQQQRQWREQMVADQRTGAAEWAASQPEMTAEHLAVLETKVAQSGIFTTAYQQANGNARQAIKASLDYLVRTDPVESQRMIDAQVAAKMAEREAENRRLNAAGSLTAGGGAPPAPAPVRVGKMSRAELESVIAQDVRTNLFGDGS